MEKAELMEKMDEMRLLMGDVDLLDALAQAMDSNELQENLEFIDRMHDLDLFN